MFNELDFDDLTPIELPVSYGGRKFILREASEDTAVKWQNSVFKATKMADGKVSGLEGLADSEPLLVSLCLSEKTDAGEKLVPINLVRSWPARVVKALFEKAKEISDLGPKESPERRALLAALVRDDAPVSIDDFRVWIAAILSDDATFKPLADLVKPAEESPAKNTSRATADTSA